MSGNMNIPTKPWEMSNYGPNSSIMNNGLSPNAPNSQLYVSNTDRLHSTAIPFPGGGGGRISTNTAPPPLPPRPNQTRPIYSASAYNRSSMMPYSSPYSGGYNPYGGGFSPYSSYSSYGYGGGSMYGNRPYYGSGYEPGVEPSFGQLAEESSASAFQSIESFVGAFGSISMMLESTFHALYSSFRAVVGVADHLGRLKQILSALAIFRFFKWTLRRILYLIGISKIKPETIESLWSEVAGNMQDSPGAVEDMLLNGEPTKPSSWPIVMFLGFIFAGPYLMWKLVKSLNLDGSQSGNSRKWATGDTEHFVAEVIFPFDAATERELNLKPGQNIRLAPAKQQPNNVRGWALASDGAKLGLVPLNYIKVLGKRTGNSMNRLVPLNHDSDTSSTSGHAQTRPRVRFDLNPKPSESGNPSYKTELPGILKHDDTSTITSSSGPIDPVPIHTDLSEKQE